MFVVHSVYAISAIFRCKIFGIDYFLPSLFAAYYPAYIMENFEGYFLVSVSHEASYLTFFPDFSRRTVSES